MNTACFTRVAMGQGLRISRRVPRPGNPDSERPVTSCGRGSTVPIGLRRLGKHLAALVEGRHGDDLEQTMNARSVLALAKARGVTIEADQRGLLVQGPVDTNLMWAIRERELEIHTHLMRPRRSLMARALGLVRKRWPA